MANLHKCLITLAVLLLHQIDNSMGQYEHVWATEQPSQSYTVFNGKVYMQPEEKGFFSNLFNFDLYSNPVVQTVLGWTDYFYGSSANETEGLLVDPLASTGSQNYPQYYGNGAQPQSLQNQYPNGGYNKNVLSSYDDKYRPQGGEYGKYPNNAVPPHPYYSQFAQMQQPQQQQQQQQQQYGQQFRPRPQYPPQQPPPTQYPQMGAYGQYQQQPGTPPPQTVNIYSNPYGSPNVEIMHGMESLGNNIEALVSHATASQERHFRAGVSQQRPHPMDDSQQQPMMEKSDPEKSAPTSFNYEEMAPEKKQMKASPKADSSDMVEDHYPCPVIGQWKWDGELCIALGPAPTWACRPNDLTTSGRIAICRNKIYFPNEGSSEDRQGV